MTEPEEEFKLGDKLEARFVRSPQSRVIHVDGAWGGATGQGNVHAAIYSEHRALPEVVVYVVEDQPGRAHQVGAEGGEFLLREIEAELIMSPVTARSFGEWLLEKANDALGQQRKIANLQNREESTPQTEPSE